MKHELQGRTRVLKGVKDVLEAISQYSGDGDGAGGDGSNTAWIQGLLTGNLRRIAMLKLEAADIDAERLFQFGAFGCEHEQREHLAKLALVSS